jgi:hypothetical protein
MVRQLYNLEDRLFYASRTCGPVRGRMLEIWSQRIGAVADRLKYGLVARPTAAYARQRV